MVTSLATWWGLLWAEVCDAGTLCVILTNNSFQKKEACVDNQERNHADFPRCERHFSNNTAGKRSVKKEIRGSSQVFIFVVENVKL